MGKCNDSVKEQRSEHFEEVETTQFVLDSIFVDLDIKVHFLFFRYQAGQLSVDTEVSTV